MFLIIELLFIVLLSMILYMIYKNERLLSKKVLPMARVEEFWNGRERRQHERFRKNLEVIYKVQKKSVLKNGNTVDISEGGAKLLLDEKLIKGTLIYMQIPLPGSRGIAEVEGEIVWSEEFKDGANSDKRLFHAGMKFFAIKEPQGANLIEYIHSFYEEPRA